MLSPTEIYTPTAAVADARHTGWMIAAGAGTSQMTIFIWCDPLCLGVPYTAPFEVSRAAAMTQSHQLVEHRGACHCGAVKFECDAPADVLAWDCNCSYCYVRRNTHFFVPAERFRLLQGADQLTEYKFNTRTATHLFCKTCGICCFYRPRSNPSAYAITTYCVTSGTLDSVEVRHFDGTNWEASFASTGIATASKL